MTTPQSSYRQIFKATSIFGGVKVFEIIIKIIRSKIIAVLLGPEGMGIQGLFTSTTALITGLTNFGLGTSAVKNVAAANGSGDKTRIAEVVGVLRRLVWVTGILGAVITLVFSSYLSEITFGSKDYTIGFIWLSITLLLNQLSTGQTVLLRGMRQINYLAKSSLSGSVLGLVISVPVYYLYGIDGIVPAIILTSVATLARTWYYARKIKIEKVDVDTQTTITEGKDMLAMGFMLSISGLYVLAKNYGIRAFISNISDLEQVGLYSAGFMIINTYVGMIFTSMATDFYPRLSGISHEIKKAKVLISQQLEVAILLITPILATFITYIGWIIIILYSEKFIPIDRMLQWAALGMFFKAVSFPIAYIFLARGDSKVFLANELFAGTVTLSFHLLGYYYGGLTGIGIGFMLGYFYYIFHVTLVSYWRYKISFEIKLIPKILISLTFLSLCILISLFAPKNLSYLINMPVIIASFIFSYRELNTKIDFAELVKKLFSKK